MENRIGNSDGAEIPKKSRSLDLKSLYKSKVSMASQKTKELKRKISSGDGEEKSNKKKKSSKTVSISSLKNVDNSKRVVGEVYNGGLSLGLQDTKEGKLGLNHKWDNGGGFGGISFGLDDGGVRIPKRKRGFVGRKKVEVSKVVKLQGQSCSRVGSVDQVAKVNGDDSATVLAESPKDLATQVESPKDSGREVESSKNLGRQAEYSKDLDREVESSKDLGGNVESSKDLGGKVESSKELCKKVESSKELCKKVESLKDLDRKVESSKNSSRHVDSLKDLGTQVESSKVKRKKVFDSSKAKRNGESNSARHSTKEGGCASHSIGNNGESSVKKETRNSDSSVKKEIRNSDPKSNRHLRGDSAHADPIVTVNGDSSEKKSNRISSSNLAQDLKEDDKQASHLVNNGESSLKKSRRKNSKRKSPSHDRSNAKEAEPSVGTSVKVCDDLLEDEKNLEENAAMMLSSRFDPSCTGFSSNGKSVASKSQLSFVSSSERDLHAHGSESALFDAAGRALRPRMEQKEKGQSRKRRHYYEVFSGDLDAHWVLNRRIKVFWPLDQCWYYGLVNDYDEERKHHHVKYDDRDEEWISLENERFKLLLLPSEVPGKAGRRRSRIKEKFPDQGKESLKLNKEIENRNLITEDEKCMGSYMDSEPIISWLARSTRRVKSSPFHAMKKQKTSDPSLNSEPSLLSDEDVKANGWLDGGCLGRGTYKSTSQSELTDRFANGRRAEDSVSGSPARSKDGKHPIVYYRRRLRNTGNMLSLSSSSNCVSSGTPASSTLLAPLDYGCADAVEHVVALERLDFDETLWSVDNAGLFKLIESRQVRFELSFPVLSLMNYAFEAENLWLVRAVFLLHHGTLMTTSPRVHLEMLFVDNVFGLKFLLFEGCLKQAVAHVFLVLTVFCQPDEPEKYADLQLPVTSIRFKFSCVQDLRKQLVFAFYNFAEVKNSMWMYLDSKLKRHCLLTRQLPLSECTFDNIKAFQNGSNQLIATSACGDDGSAKGLQRSSRSSISLSSTCGKASQFSSNSNKNQRKFSPFAISFAAAPTLFIGLHLKLLMEQSRAPISFQGHGSTENPECPSSVMVDDCSSLGYCLNKDSESIPQNISSESILGHTVKDSLMDVASDSCLSVANSELSAVAQSVHDNGHWVRSPQKLKTADVDIAGTSSCSRNPEENGKEAIQKWQGHDLKFEHALSPRPSVNKDKLDTGSRSPLNGIRVEVPTFDQFEKHADREFHSAQRSTDLSWNMNGGVIPSPNPTAPRSTWHRNRSSSLSFGHLSHGWSDGKADIGHSNFGTGPKKPRTQVSYSLPFGGVDYSSKNRGHNQKGVHHTRIRRPNEKRFSDVSRGSQKNLELLSCDANVLITLGDKGWRECGAQIVLELFDHHEWKLAVKVSGMTKYSYKAHQFMQPGSTNRYTHAMMWKGGKDWILEFPDRSQWALFKEMHEECYNRNVRAASVKNIPIPGVRFIEDTDDNGAEVAFFRCSRYFRQVETDVEMALNPLRILYDMDSDDEQWILKNCNSSEADNKGFSEISEEMFEKAMDMFEKAAYRQQRDQFTPDEIEELMAGVGSMEAIKTIHEHWRQKRQKKGMPLIRYLQPPLWERYQQQVREWEITMSKLNTAFPNGYQEKVAPVEKPAMFAFCLKPRGLEVPNKGSKQRSQRRISVSGKSNPVIGDHDGFHTFGRRLNGFAFGDEKVVYPGHNYESLDDSPLSQTSPRVFSPQVFSPRDTGSMDYFSMSIDGFDRNQYQKLQRKKSKRMFDFSYDPHTVASSNQRLMARGNGIHRWNMGYADWTSQRHLYLDGSLRHGPEQFDSSDLDEFRLRDASGAAQHARNMAKLKREKAQRLLYRADLAIHKAVAALMTAEAIKASYDDDDVNSDG